MEDLAKKMFVNETVFMNDFDVHAYGKSFMWFSNTFLIITNTTYMIYAKKK